MHEYEIDQQTIGYLEIEETDESIDDGERNHKRSGHEVKKFYIVTWLGCTDEYDITSCIPEKMLKHYEEKAVQDFYDKGGFHA